MSAVTVNSCAVAAILEKSGYYRPRPAAALVPVPPPTPGEFIDRQLTILVDRREEALAHARILKKDSGCTRCKASFAAEFALSTYRFLGETAPGTDFLYLNPEDVTREAMRARVRAPTVLDNCIECPTDIQDAGHKKVTAINATIAKVQTYKQELLSATTPQAAAAIVIKAIDATRV